ncbi:type II secretion system protein J [Deinococcus malanensis]|uniref:PulJ/GspJ family protein n=1 Tax=Deinococcus malanensis TaxID=1706855 RepID=UPI00362C9471
MNPRGFTLLELLVVMAISGIVLTVLFDIFTSSNRSVADGTHYAQELRELQISGAIAADDVRKAQYVYPAAQTLTLESAYPATVSNPETNTNTWETKPNGSFLLRSCRWTRTTRTCPAGP